MTALDLLSPSVSSDLASSSPTTTPCDADQFKRGSVYVFQDERGHVKIGWARKPEARLELIAAGNPYRIELAYSEEMPAPLARVVERKAHKILGDRRTAGKGSLKEWFNATADEAIAAVHSALAETDLADCPVPSYDRRKEPGEFQVVIRLPADVAAAYRRLCGCTVRSLPNFLSVMLTDAVTGQTRVLDEVQRHNSRRR